MFPTVDVADHFESETEARCAFMEWDDKKNMIVDNMAPDETEVITADENLVRFTFDVHNKVTSRPTTRPSPQTPIANFPPHDDDSISTLHPSDRTTLTTATNHNLIQSNSTNSTSQQPTNPTKTSNSSISSQTTDISLQSFLNLESKVAGIATQMMLHQHRHALQFNKIIAALGDIHPNNSEQDNPPTTQSNTAGSNSQSSGQGL